MGVCCSSESESRKSAASEPIGKEREVTSVSSFERMMKKEHLDPAFKVLLASGRSFQVNNVKFEPNNWRSPALDSMPLAEKIVTQLATKMDLRTYKRIKLLTNRSSHSAFENRANVDVCAHNRVKHAFVSTVIVAFDEHRPLTLKPVHFWMLIARAVAKHVNDNANELKAKFLVHADQQEKIKLEVIRDNFSTSFNADNDWAGVVSEFNDQIKQHVLNDVLPTLSPDFSGKTLVEDIALKVTVMDCLQQFFEYRVTTECGFPKITLLGTLDDWKLLRSSAHHLISTKCTKEFANKWLPALDSVLAKLEETAIILHSAEPQDNKIDRTFWSSFCKRGGSFGSGGTTWINGWITVFFPTLKKGRLLEPYSDKIWYAQHAADEEFSPVFNSHKGIDEDDFDDGLSTAPVIWECGGEISLEFKSGFVGTRIIRGEDAETGADGVMPEVGWWIQNKPQEDEKEKLRKRTTLVL